MQRAGTGTETGIGIGTEIETGIMTERGRDTGNGQIAERDTEIDDPATGKRHMKAGGGGEKTRQEGDIPEIMAMITGAVQMLQILLSGGFENGWSVQPKVQQIASSCAGLAEEETVHLPKVWLLLLSKLTHVEK